MNAYILTFTGEVGCCPFAISCALQGIVSYPFIPKLAS